MISTKKPARKQIIRSLLVLLLLLGAATGIGYLFRYAGFPETNIVIIYILSVLITAMFTPAYGLDIIASLAATLTFNFFFTEPYFTFAVDDPSYLITFAVMTITALITSALTSRVSKNANEAKEKEAEASSLYKLTNRLTDADSIGVIVHTAVSAISDVIECDAACLRFNDSGMPDDFFLQQTKSGKIVRRALTNAEEVKSRIDGLHTAYDRGEEFYDFPIYGRDSTLGVIRIPTPCARQLNERHLAVLHSMIENIALAMDRLYIAQKQLKAREETDRERYRSNLLRAISHDLRTPLAGILGSSMMLKDVAEDKEAVVRIAGDIYKEADWLHSLVENILNLTRLQDGKLLPKKEPEAVEEIIGFSIESISRRYPGIEVSVSAPDELLLVPMDARLISQVLINILDNAVKNSVLSSYDEKTNDARSIDGISLEVTEETGFVRFTVSDNGTGIKEEDLPYIFESFYTADKVHTDAHQGVGLGLTICKSIINAHGGEISADNRTDRRGMQFTFTLPKV